MIKMLIVDLAIIALLVYGVIIFIRDKAWESGSRKRTRHYAGR